jgi:hypothetical protein
MSIVLARPAISMQRVTREGRTTWPAPPVLLFLVGLIVPWTITFASFGLTVPRLVLLATIVPCLVKWARGDAGPYNVVDFLVLGLCFCICLSLSVVAGVDAGIKSGGMIVVETAGSYFLARCFVRTADDFLAVVRVLFLCVIVLLPLALVEALTTENLAMAAFGAILPTVPVSFDGLRWGLKRVQSVYEHPILFGVCTGSTLALVYLVLGQNFSLWKRVLCAGLVMATAFLSISSGAMAMMAFQIALIAWGRTTARVPHNWLILGGFFALACLAIQFGTRQSVPQFYISYFSLDRETAWLRLLIWEFGSASVMSHPYFGIGFGDWARPSWMSDSIDMFWMTTTMRYGIPGGSLMILLPTATLAIVAFAKHSDPRILAYRMAYLIAIGGFFLVGWTVHFWGATYLSFLFILGAGGWLAEGTAASAPALNPISVRAPVLRGGAGVAHLQRAGRLT